MRAWIVREMQGRRLKVEGPVVPRETKSGHREVTVIALSDAVTIRDQAVAQERERLLSDEAVVAEMPTEPERTPLQEAIRKARGDEPTAEEIEQSIGFLNRMSAAMRDRLPEGGESDGE